MTGAAALAIASSLASVSRGPTSVTPTGRLFGPRPAGMLWLWEHPRAKSMRRSWPFPDIAGQTDLDALLAGVAESLRPIVSFDHIGLILHDPNGNAMQGHILNEPCNPVITSLRLPVDQDPAGWVWLNQQPLVVSPVQSETRWPEFVSRARDLGISTLLLVPLTTGNNRLGAFGFSSVAPFDPSPAEIAFLERVASEFAVAVESFLAKQEAVRERDRLRTLFDITNALVSKLERDELFSAISDQLSKVIRHDYALLTLCNARPACSICTRCIPRVRSFYEAFEGTVQPAGHAGGRGARQRESR